MFKYQGQFINLDMNINIDINSGMNHKLKECLILYTNYSLADKLYSFSR